MIRLAPDYIKAYRFRGRIWADKGEPGKAIADFTEVIRRDPKDADTYLPARQSVGARSEPDKAMADYTEAIRLAPEEASALHPARRHPRGQGEIDAAIADFDRAIRLDPAGPFAYGGRGRAWDARGIWIRPLPTSTGPFRSTPISPSPTTGRGVTSWLHREEYDKAIRDYTRAIEGDPRIGDA